MIRPLIVSGAFLALACAGYLLLAGGASSRSLPQPQADAAPTKPRAAPVIETSSSVRTHRVRRGETLSHIAARFYGDATRWPAIAAANGLANAKRLRAGDRLVIPRLPGADRDAPAAEIASPAPAAPEPVTPRETPKPAAPATTSMHPGWTVLWALLALIPLTPLAAGCYWMGASAAEVEGRSWRRALAAGLSATALTAGLYLLAGLFYRITPLSVFLVAAFLLAVLGFGGRVVMLADIYRLAPVRALNVWGSAVLASLILAVGILALVSLGATVTGIFQ